MKAYEIIADSSCDLEEEVCKKHNIRLVYGHICMPDGNEVDAVPQWEEQSADENNE